VAAKKCNNLIANLIEWVLIRTSRKLIIGNGTTNASTFIALQLTESESEELTFLSQISTTKIGLSIG
jgi:hypothetical protein